ncbi:metal ABC transporter solute-binding protein, Zn/Mn family [Allocoleopsis sp.]|uniref:metal ABC transporter solute-binding protein, Zn/Mn family n=1 Tax=Allocoleopsis sp. TaxID=3088169 RepID=UPI002FCFE8DF
MLKSLLFKTCAVANATVLALALGLAGCTSKQETANSSRNTTAGTSSVPVNSQRAKVVATSSVLCDITEKIAQDTVDLTCLIPAGTDPHVYAPKPSDRKAIEQANLILYNGYGFEADLIKLIQSTNNSAPKVAVGEIAVSKPLKGEEHEHESREKAAVEQEHGEFDPHVWHDAKNGVRMVEVVLDNLKKLSPKDDAKYISNTEKITRELTQLDTWIKSEISTIPAKQRKLVTTHDSMGYYAVAYGIPIEGALQGISTDEKPTAGRVKELVDEIKKASVPTIFAEATINPKLIETVSREAQVNVSTHKLFADGLGERGTVADTYEKMLIANTQAIVTGLGGKYTPFQLK